MVEIGDRVKVKVDINGHDTKGKEGTVVNIDQEEPIIGVRFSEEIGNENLNGACRDCYGLWAKESQIEVLNKQPRKAQYIVKYDTEEQDPMECAYSKEEMKELVISLFGDCDVITESIKVFKVEKEMIPKINIKVE